MPRILEYCTCTVHSRQSAQPGMNPGLLIFRDHTFQYLDPHNRCKFLSYTCTAQYSFKGIYFCPLAGLICKRWFFSKEQIICEFFILHLLSETFDYCFYSAYYLLCPKNNLNNHIRTEPVMDGAYATVYFSVQTKHTVIRYIHSIRERLARC